MSTPMLLAADSESSPDQQEPNQPWLRLLLVMTVPVLMLLVGMSLTR
jgi:hypothetical protein